MLMPLFKSTITKCRIFTPDFARRETFITSKRRLKHGLQPIFFQPSKRGIFLENKQTKLKPSMNGLTSHINLFCQKHKKQTEAGVI